MTKVVKVNSRVKVGTKSSIAKKRIAAVSRTVIYPMMPRKYTAAQRAELRRFERDILAGKKITVE